MSASHSPGPSMAWSDPAANGGSPRVGSGGMLPSQYSRGAGGLFAGLDPAPPVHKSDYSRSMPYHEREALEDQVRKMRVAVAGLKDQNVGARRESLLLLQPLYTTTIAFTAWASRLRFLCVPSALCAAPCVVELTRCVPAPLPPFRSGCCALSASGLTRSWAVRAPTWSRRRSCSTRGRRRSAPPCGSERACLLPEWGSLYSRARTWHGVELSSPGRSLWVVSGVQHGAEAVTPGVSRGIVTSHVRNCVRPRSVPVMRPRAEPLPPCVAHRSGLSQMYRNPDTTALVTRLKEQVRVLRAEKDRFKGDLEELLKGTK